MIIYFDISDIYDDNRKYKLINDKISRKISNIIKYQRTLKSSFPFWYSIKKLKNDVFKTVAINKCTYLDYCHEKVLGPLTINFLEIKK